MFHLISRERERERKTNLIKLVQGQDGDQGPGSSYQVDEYSWPPGRSVS